MKKLLYVVTGLRLGGAEILVANLADKARSDGYLVKIAYLTGSVEVSPSDSDIELIPLNVTSMISFIISFWKLRALIVDFKPDVVHSHMVHANILTRLCRLIVEMPRLICTAHSPNEGGRVRMLLYRITHYLGDVFTSVSKEAAILLEKSGAAPRDSILAIPNGIDTAVFSPLSKKKVQRNILTIVAVGRLEKEKDYPCLLTALCKVKGELGHKFQVKVVGDGSRRRSLELMADSLGLQEHIKWLGTQRDIPAILNSADCFVLSSEYEGFGLVVAEAMACGLPVIVTDCGVKEVVGESELMVPIGDSSALAKSIISVLRMTEGERKCMGIQNRERVLNLFSEQQMWSRYKLLYADK